MASLFQACKAAVRNKEGGTFNIGGYDIDIEMMSQKDIDDNIKWGNIPFGDSDESKILLMASETITVPEGYTLTPDSPKKSLVIFCNTLVNNGTISMYRKAPNTLPHDYFIIQGNIIGSNKNVVIPAYANNQVNTSGGLNGTNRQCGSGGLGNVMDRGREGNLGYYNGDSVSGSGYAFGGGAGTGACIAYGMVWDQLIQKKKAASVDQEYPMRGGASQLIYYDNNYQGNATSGAGNPYAGTIHNRGYGSVGGDNHPPFGCGGRVIIFCSSFENNGIITADGTSQTGFTGQVHGYGGASGGGAVDLFFTNLISEGTITAKGGDGPYTYTKGGNGSVTLTQWNLDKVIKEERKMFTKNNWIYLFDNYSQRLREDVI